MDVGRGLEQSRENNLPTISMWQWLKGSTGATRLRLLLFIGIPLAIGYLMLVLIGWNRYERAFPPSRAALEEVQFVSIGSVLSTEIEKSVMPVAQRIADSISSAMPLDRTALFPFLLHPDIDITTGNTSILLDCRLSCSCMNLSPEQFRLVIFQIDPTTQSTHMVANDVMTWADYLKPFSLHNQKEATKQ